MVFLDGDRLTGRVYHASHESHSNGWAPALARDRRRDGRGLRETASTPCYKAAERRQRRQGLDDGRVVRVGGSRTVRKLGMDRDRNPLPARGHPSLLDQVCDVIRRLRFSIRTEQGCVDWIGRFMLFRGSAIPGRWGAEGGTFLTALAVNSNVASSTQNHATTPSCSSIGR